MAGTRSSARLSQSSPGSNKRKADDAVTPTKAKKGKKAGEQQTIEQSLDNAAGENGEHKNGHNEGHEMQDVQKSEEEQPRQTTEAVDVQVKEAAAAEKHEIGQNGDGNEETGTEATVDADGGKEIHAPAGEAQDDDDKQKTADTGNVDSENGAVEEDKAREDAQPSNILEKGIIYFFTRGRVGVDDIESVQDLQRSHFVLRPLPDGAKLGDGTINEMKNARLVALPKKVWPKSPQDKFMAFVEKAGATVKELKDEFFQGSEYSTKTVGVRQTPPVTPIGEGVYAITSTGNRGESHLAYMLTIPQQPGELQADVGIKAQGSFLISLKNPEVKGPANASLPQKPDWPKEFLEEFRNRSWMPAEPKHLDYANAQMLLIGESFDESHALEPTKKDEENESKETPREEIEKLGNEDQIRIKHLKGDDTIFADLQISKKDYPDVQTTW